MADDDAELVAAAFAGVRKAGWQRANCPLCVYADGKPDVRQSMGVNFTTGGYVCHKCQSTGLVAEWAPEDLGADLPDLAVEAPPARVIEPAHLFCPIGEEPWHDSEVFAWARDYVAGRGIEWSTVVNAHVGAANAGPLRERIIVPHFQPDGCSWAGWIARDVTGKAHLKYRYSKGMQRDLLWNQRVLYEDTDVPLALVEGVFDALPYWPDVCAFLGKPTKAHFETLSRHRGRPIVCMLDGDAKRESWSLAMKLRFAGVPSVGMAKLPVGEDPCSLGFARGWELVLQNVGQIPRFV